MTIDCSGGHGWATVMVIEIEQRRLIVVIEIEQRSSDCLGGLILVIEGFAKLGCCALQEMAEYGLGGDRWLGWLGRCE